MKDLLLLICRYPFDENNRERLSTLLREVTDWPEAVRLINAHGIIALAAYNIKEANLEYLIPADQWKIIEDGYLQSVVRNTWLTQCWKEVNSILSAAGIKHILLKGMALEHTLYGSKGLRQMTDNDILVKEGDALKAWYLLQEHGFKHNLMKSPLHKMIMLDIGKHLPCLYKNGYAVEIHHSLFGKEYNDQPFENSLEIRVNNTQAFILSEHDQLRHLTDHFNKHAAGGDIQIRQYADIILSDKNTLAEFPDIFITRPNRAEEKKYRRSAYKLNVRSIPAGKRIIFLAGDIFPSLKWMKKRYRCSTFAAFFHYPMRSGKLLWII